MNHQSAAGSNAASPAYSDPRPATQTDRITNALETNNLTVANIESRLYDVVARLVGEQPTEGKKNSAVQPVQSGVLGSFEDALSIEALMLSQIQGVLSRLETAV